jgi:signal transduction histidine kinase
VTSSPYGDLSERVLLLTPIGRDADLGSAVLGAAGFLCHRCASIAALAEEIGRGAGAVLVTEEVLGAGAVRTLAAALAGQEAWSDLPVIVLGRRSGSPQAKGLAMSALAPLGNVTMVDRPLRRATLVSVAQSALRARRRQYAAREVLAQLAEAVRQRDTFLAMLGHELRNPLAAIEIAGQLLEHGKSAPRQLSIIRRQARQLSRLVDDLLEVSRVTSGKIILNRTALDLSQLVDRCVEAHVAPAEQKYGVSVSRAPSGGQIPIDGDETRLEQVISNLISNGVKYTPRGGHVVVSAERQAGVAVVKVRDDGIGIAAEDLARIFEPFVQLAPALDRARGGMGLGLTLVRRLVEMHGGAISARSDGTDGGSEFEVQLPLGAAAQV